MLTAMLAVRNLFGEQHCLWDVNADDEYHEQENVSPERVTRAIQPSPVSTDAAGRSSIAMTRPERRRAGTPVTATPLSVSVIVPFHANLHQLDRCLASLLPLPPRTEVIVAADRAPKECEDVALRMERASFTWRVPAGRRSRATRPRLRAAATC